MTVADIAIHADCGPGVGLGHATRCCALAVALARQGLRPALLNGQGGVLDAAGFQSAGGDQPDPDAVAAAARNLGARMLVLDSYRLDHRVIAPSCSGLRVVWFDDDARDPPDCDAIINGSPAAAVLGYRLPAHTLEMLGPRYQIVRPGLTPRNRDGALHRFLVTYGGADPKNIGPILAQAANELCEYGLSVDFVVGPFAPVPENLGPGPVLHHAPDDMPSLINAADAAICAGGQTLIELAAAGVPAAAIGIGSDQAPNLDAFTQAGAVLFAGWAEDADFPQTLGAALERLVQDQDLRLSLAHHAGGMIDGRGAARIALALKAML